MKKKLLHLYAQEWNWFRTKVFRLFLVTLLAFVAASVAYHFYYVDQPDKAQSRMQELQEIFSKLKQDASGWERVLFYIMNNTKTTFLHIAFGLIPLLFIPLLQLNTMCSFSGVLSSLLRMSGHNPLFVYALGIAPHGIIEIPATIYSYCLGIMLCFKISKKMLVTFNPFHRKAQESPLFSAEYDESESLSAFIYRCFRSWLLVIVPLLLIAALIEGFITPFLLTNFL